jgi:hypothetical protein
MGMGVPKPRSRAAIRFSLVAAALFATAALAAPASAAPTLTFVPDAHTPVLPAGDQLAAVADVNGDGVPDLIVHNQFAGTVGVLLGDGAGGFGPASSISIGGVGRPFEVLLADFNGDGHPDLLIGLETAPSEHQPNPSPEAVEVMLGDGHGGFSAGPQTHLKQAGELLVGDFNGDGHEDAAEVPGCGGTLAGYMVSDSSTVNLFLGDGHGGLSAGPSTTVNVPACAWLAGDLNGDGRSDIATISGGHAGEGNHLVVEPGDADGHFGPALDVTLPPTVSFLRDQPVDLDGNHTLDLVAEGFTAPSTIYLLSNDGSAHFALAGPYASGVDNVVCDPVVGEFMGEGHPSILSVGPSVSLLEPVASGGLSPTPIVPYSGPDNNAFVADVNRDGRNDLILSNQTALSILLNEPAVPVLTGVSISPRTWRDGSTLASLSRRRAPRGATVSFSLNVAASVKLAFSERVGARRNRRAPRYASRGALVLSAHAGSDRIDFQGWLSRAHRLAPGSYRVTLTATNVTGTSQPTTLAFTVVR